MTGRPSREDERQESLSAASKLLPNKRKRKSTGRAEEAMRALRPRTRTSRQAAPSQALTADRMDESVESSSPVADSPATSSSPAPAQSEAGGASGENSKGSLMVALRVKVPTEKEMEEAATTPEAEVKRSTMHDPNPVPTGTSTPTAAAVTVSHTVSMAAATPTSEGVTGPEAIRRDQMVRIRRQVYDLNPELVDLTIDIRIDDCLSNSTRPDGAFTGWRATSAETLVKQYELHKVLELEQLKVLRYRLAGDFIGWRQQFIEECLAEVGEWFKKESDNRIALQLEGFLALRDAEWNPDNRLTEEEREEIEEKRKATKGF